jgi:hypothetical protein
MGLVLDLVQRINDDTNLEAAFKEILRTRGIPPRTNITKAIIDLTYYPNLSQSGSARIDKRKASATLMANQINSASAAGLRAVPFVKSCPA